MGLLIVLEAHPMVASSSSLARLTLVSLPEFKLSLAQLSHSYSLSSIIQMWFMDTFDF